MPAKNERVIAVKDSSFPGSRNIVLRHDPTAPSMSEITEALRQARTTASSHYRRLKSGFDNPEHAFHDDGGVFWDMEDAKSLIERLDGLIDQLESDDADN